MRGLYRGFFPTWGREAIGQTVYFSTYELIRRACIAPGQKPSEAPLVASLIGGFYIPYSRWNCWLDVHAGLLSTRLHENDAPD
jgi:hypothetical protein